MNELLQEVADNVKGLGIPPPSAPDVTFDEILQSDIDLDEITLEEFEEYLQQIAAYNIFLKSQKGSYEARLKIMKAEYDRYMALETRAGPQSTSNGGWLSKDEKEAAALQTSAFLADLRNKMLVLDATIAKIKDLPYAIDKKLDLLTMKLRRRIKMEA